MKQQKARRLATLVFLGLAGATAPTLAGEIRGRVISEDKGVAGATVAAVPFESAFETARREARRGAAPAALATATTKADGSYLLSVAPPAGGALVRLQVTAKGLRPTLLEAVYDAAESAEAVDAILGKSGALAGKVVDRQGGPVVGATVTLSSSVPTFFDFSGASLPPAVTTTGADGTFRFAEAGTNGNRVRVEAPGFAFAEASGLVAGAVRRPLTLALGRTISGAVVGEGRKPAAGALVRFETATGASRWFEARPDGSFLLEGIPPEGGTIVADAGDKGRGTSVVEAGVAKATVALDPTASIGGRVVDSRSGAPIPRVRVVARGEGAVFLARSGPDGRYEIKGLPLRAYQLGADDPAYVPWTREGVSVKSAAREAQDVVLTRAASLVGRVVDENGAPVEGATGMLTPSGETGPRAFFRRVGVPGLASAFRTGADGSFKATRLGPGTNQTLTVRHRDHETRTMGGVNLSGSAPTRVNVVMRRGQTIRGIVKDDRGQPVGGADVSLQREFRMESRRGMTSMSFVTGDFGRPPHQTGADGRFEVKGLASGDYTLQVSKRGYTRERIDPVKVAEDRVLEPFEVVLRTGATISGFLRDKAGNGAPGQRVGTRPAGAAGRNMQGPMGGPMTEEPTGPDGAFVIEGVVPGETYDLQVFGETGLGARKSGVTAPAEGVELLASGKGGLRGVVRDAESGRPLRDFSVSYRPSQQGGVGGMQVRFGFGGARRGAGQPLPFHADDGAFLVDEVPPGKWDVEATAEGYQAGRANGITVEEGAVAEGVEVRLSKGSVLTGRVSESRSGQPVRDAAIRAQIAGGNSMVMRFDPAGGDGRQASSDADGRFELPGLAPGTYTVTATHSDWTEASERVEVKEATAAVDIKMSAGSAISGGVVGAGQRPVAGATVSVSVAGSSGPFGGDEQSTITDAGGRFRFDRLGPGRYSLMATLRSESSTPVEVVVQAGDSDKAVDLSLRAGATIRGTVTGLPEAQRGNVYINASGPEEYYANTRTSSGGAYELTGVPTGPITLRANAGDFMTSTRSASAQVMIAEGQAEAAADIVFEEGFRIEGHVTRGGKPVAEAMVNAFPDGGGGGRGATGRTDAAGAFVLEGLAAGPYYVTAYSPTGGGQIRKRVEVAGDTSVDLEAPPGRLAGTVVEQGTGRPLGEAEVRVQSLDRQGQGPMTMTAQSTDSAGRFVFEDIEPAAYRLSVTKPAFQTEQREATAGDDADLVVEMRRGEGIGIVAKDGVYQVPLRSLFVSLSDGQNPSAFIGSVALDSDGQGEIPSLRPGSYQLRASAQGYAPVGPVPITVPSSTVSLVLTPGGTLEIQAGPETMAASNPSGRILLASGAPYVPGMFGGQGPQAGLIRLTSPVRRIENIAPGSYTFAMENGPRKSFEIREGGTATVVFP